MAFRPSPSLIALIVAALMFAVMSIPFRESNTDGPASAVKTGEQQSAGANPAR